MTNGGAGDPALDPPVGVAQPLVEECVATAFAWHDADRAADVEPGYAMLFANYPLFSPSYELELYGADLLVEIDEAYDARLTTTTWGSEGIEDVVFGRAEGEESWRVVGDPDGACPERPEGVEWPTRL